jgi:hypothetical protein
MVMFDRRAALRARAEAEMHSPDDRRDSGDLRKDGLGSTAGMPGRPSLSGQERALERIKMIASKPPFAARGILN